MNSEGGKREIYYYLRNYRNVPVVTVCVAADKNQNFARGVAICSQKDGPDKREGRRIARNRALRALGTGRMELPVTRSEAAEAAGELMEVLEGIEFVGHKAVFRPTLTDFELEVLKKTGILSS